MEVQSFSFLFYVLGLIPLFRVVMNRDNTYRSPSIELYNKLEFIEKWLLLNQARLGSLIRVIDLYQFHFYSNVSKQKFKAKLIILIINVIERKHEVIFKIFHLIK